MNKPFEFTAEDFEQIAICDNTNNLNQVFADFVNARLHRWIEAAPMVYGMNSRIWKTDQQINRCENNGMIINPDTHTARLICIEPIKQDTAEGLLQTLIELSDTPADDGSWSDVLDIIERARKLLENK